MINNRNAPVSAPVPQNVVTPQRHMQVIQQNPWMTPDQAREAIMYFGY